MKIAAVLKTPAVTPRTLFEVMLFGKSGRAPGTTVSGDATWTAWSFASVSCSPGTKNGRTLEPDSGEPPNRMLWSPKVFEVLSEGAFGGVCPTWTGAANR